MRHFSYFKYCEFECMLYNLTYNLKSETWNSACLSNSYKGLVCTFRKKKGLMEFYNGVVNGVGWLRARICHCLLSANFRIPKNRLDHFWFCGLMDKTFHIFHPKSVHYAHKLDFAICITASAFHFHAYSHPRDTMLNGTRH